MRDSFKLFLKELLISVYSLISLLLFLFDYFAKPFLPEKIKVYISLDLILMMVMILIILGGMSAFHKLRIARLNELYRYLPEANKDRMFRMFSQLYKEGEFLEGTSIERRQKWDEQVLRAIKDNCQDDLGNLYLLNTGRRYQEFSPLQDENYKTALEYVKRLLNSQF